MRLHNFQILLSLDTSICTRILVTKCKCKCFFLLAAGNIHSAYLHYCLNRICNLLFNTHLGVHDITGIE